MGNEELRKWEKCTSHFTQQTADILLLQSSNVMRKSLSNQHLLQFALKGYVYYTSALHHGR